MTDEIEFFEVPEDNIHRIFLKNEYSSVFLNFLPDVKKFESNYTLRQDNYSVYDVYGYKISLEPIELFIRLIESRNTEKKYLIKDGIVFLESEFETTLPMGLKKEDFITDLKKRTEWNKTDFFYRYEVVFFILSQHPEIISPEEYRRYLQQISERIQTGLLNIDNKLKDNESLGLEVVAVPGYKKILYKNDKDIPREEYGTAYKIVDDKFYKPLFSKDSPEYSGITEDEFRWSTEILEYTDTFLNKKVSLKRIW